MEHQCNETESDTMMTDEEDDEDDSDSMDNGMTEMQRTTGQKNTSTFEDLPIPLYNEIFKFLDLAERNKVRRVSLAWDKAVKFGFGVRLIIDNNNLQDLTTVEDVLEAQVRNLTLRIPKTTTFGYASGIRFLDICGMIYSKNLLNLLTQFPNLTDLKLTRVYLETDLRLEVTAEERAALPHKLESMSMRFLKSIHKTPGSLELGRGNNNTDTFALTPSDTSLLVLLDEFQFQNLKTLELYHDMTEEVREIRNSDMIERTRLANNIELTTNPVIEAVTRVLAKIFGCRKLKKLRLDNLPNLQTANLLQTNNNNPSTTFSAAASTGNTLKNKCDENLMNTRLTTLRLDGVTVGEWSSLIRVQNQLKIFDLVLLNTSLLEPVKLAIVNSSLSLVSVRLIVASPSDMAAMAAPAAPNNNNENLEIQQLGPAVHHHHQFLHVGVVGGGGLVQNQAPAAAAVAGQINLDDTFDLMFLFQCQQLLDLTIKYSPKKMDPSFLPISLTNLHLCGNVSGEGLLHFVRLAGNLKELVIHFCDGPMNRDIPPEHPISFNAQVIKSLVRESSTSLIHLVVSEIGASGEFEAVLDGCAGKSDVLVKIDEVTYKVTFVEGAFGRRTTVSVPRLCVKISPGFDRARF